MFKLTLTIVAFLVYISNAYEVDCEPDILCEVDANASTIVRANKYVPELLVKCMEASSCKKNGIWPGLIVYSSANYSNILCKGDDSCEETSLNFGITPAGELDSEYADNIREKVYVTCTGKQSCKTININNAGTVRNGLTIITPDDPVNDLKASFLAGQAQCGIDTHCILNCGSHIDSCKDAKCYGNCECKGSACPNGYNSIPTVEPTQSPVIKTTAAPLVVSPTPKPTPSPTDARNMTMCDVNNCVLEPEDYYDVYCGVQYEYCTVDCSEATQCANGVIVNADSANVKVICGATNSCDKLEIISSTQANNVIVEVSAQKAAESLKITTLNEAATLTVIVDGQEGWTNGELYCDSNCDIRCAGKDSCKLVLYECLTTQDKCLLDCDSNNNQCPSIRNYGDSSCDSPDCTVIADGSSRIVATNAVDTLTIICDESNQQCKKDGAGLRVFSGARNNIIHCSVQDGCEGASLNIGELTGSRVPKGFKASEFAGGYTRNVTAECSHDSACKGLRLYTEGQVDSVLFGDGDNALAGIEATCDGCDYLELNCREFDGCLGANVFCSDVSVCYCFSAYEVDIGNDTAVLATTEAPRDSCPLITPITNRQSGISSHMHSQLALVNSSGMKNGLKIVLPILIVAALFVVIIGFIMVKRRKSYTTINSSKTKNSSQHMLKNENIYATYQVEMH